MTLPIVYLPGGGGRARSSWRPVADRLWKRGAPIVFGYPGFGDVPPDAEPALARRSLLKLGPRRCSERFHLVAQSMGGVLALRMALSSTRSASRASCSAR